MRPARRFAKLLPLPLLATCALPTPAPEPADLLFVGGDLVTVDDTLPSATALAVRAGRIVAVGSNAEVLRWRGPSTRIVDLAGKTMLPGFVDPHSHIAGYEPFWGTPDLSPPPVGSVTSIADLQRALLKHLDDHVLPSGGTLLASGYDDSFLAERRHPTRADLDAVTTTRPVVLVHASGHLMAVNSAALAAVKITRDTQDPAGGTIRRDAAGEPTGVVEELAALPFVALLPHRTLEEQLANFAQIQLLYASHGITTAQDGITMTDGLRMLRAASDRGQLILDVVSYPRWDQFDDVLAGKRRLDIEYHPPGADCFMPLRPGQARPGPRIADASKTQVGVYRNRLKIAGVKITVDGSPQGRTAFLTMPYMSPPEGKPADYRGYPSVTQDELDKWFDLAWREHVQLLVHCNGDAAADMMLQSVKKAIDAHGEHDLRPVMIHAQAIRRDQVEAMARLHVVPSFFTAHTYYWGDWHRTSTLGAERAAGISPCATAKRLGVRFTNHTDANVVPPSHLMAMWTAVQRRTRSGFVLGPDERIGVMDALRAVTIDAAWQYFEERDKGSLTVGKLADLAILDRNPLKVDAEALRDLIVLETIKEGRTIWYRAPAPPLGEK